MEGETWSGLYAIGKTRMYIVVAVGDWSIINIPLLAEAYIDQWCSHVSLIHLLVFSDKLDINRKYRYPLIDGLTYIDESRF